jgi:hypothetical protein
VFLVPHSHGITRPKVQPREILGFDLPVLPPLVMDSLESIHTDGFTSSHHCLRRIYSRMTVTNSVILGPGLVPFWWPQPCAHLTTEYRVVEALLLPTPPLLLHIPFECASDGFWSAMARCHRFARLRVYKTSNTSRFENSTVLWFLSQQPSQSGS